MKSYFVLHSIVFATLLYIPFGYLYPPYCCAYEDQELNKLKRMELEDLLTQPVTSVSKCPESQFQAGAAVYVMTSGSIRRSGATNLPDLLRLVPGIQVARLDANKWAISCRGFNGRFSNKLKVLMDGRELYTSGFSGVLWSRHGIILKDIERIEIVRGPGASLWGTNAVNGVINIITKKASGTQGGHISSLVGNEEQSLEGRIGGRTGPNTFYRVHVKGRNGDSGGNTSVASHDGSKDARGGFRMDWEPLGRNEASFQGDVYAGSFDQTIALPETAVPSSWDNKEESIRKNGGNLNFRYARHHSHSSTTRFQLYYDRLLHDETVTRYTSDVVKGYLQHACNPLQGHELVMGMAIKMTRTGFENTDIVTFSDPTSTRTLYSGFIQDKIDLYEQILHCTLGTRYEYDEDWGDALEPTIRLVFSPNEMHTLWGSVSHAVRSPSVGEQKAGFSSIIQDPNLTGNIPVAIRFSGGKEFGKERLTAFELGYRISPCHEISFDIAYFDNRYDDLRTASVDISTMASGVLDVGLTNKMTGHAYGGEAVLDWHPFEQWRMQASYALLVMELEIDGQPTDRPAMDNEGDSPKNQIVIRSLLDLSKEVQLDMATRYVDSLHISSEERIPSYVGLDIRLAWRPRPGVEFSLVGRDLLEDEHQEFFPQALQVVPTTVQRSVHATMTFTF